MTGYERITAALRGEPTDGIPVMLHNFLMAAKEHGVTMEQYRNSARIIADTFISSMDKYDYDGILVDIDTVTLAGAVGVRVDFPVKDAARSHGGCLDRLDSVFSLKPVKITDYKYVNIWLEAVRLLKEHYGNDKYIRGNCDQAPFSLASMMRGVQNWMIDLMTGPEDQLFALLEYCTDVTSQFIKLMAMTGCDMVSNGDSPAGPDMVSPELYAKYALPYEKKIVDVAHAAGLPYTLHICGNTEAILDRMPEIGADAFELDYKTDISRILETLGKKTAFIGNIDPSGVLAMGTPEEVRIKTKELLDIYAGKGKFILNAGCAIPSTTPSENLIAMIQTARNYKIN
jgi:MtaA/CmuA family methyltransferase